MIPVANTLFACSLAGIYYGSEGPQITDRIWKETLEEMRSHGMKIQDAFDKASTSMDIK